MKRPKDILSQPYHIQEYIKYLESNVVLDSVMLSETLDEAEKIATEIDNGKSEHSLGESQGFESGAEWVIGRIKEKLHSA